MLDEKILVHYTAAIILSYDSASLTVTKSYLYSCFKRFCGLFFASRILRIVHIKRLTDEFPDTRILLMGNEENRIILE